MADALAVAVAEGAEGVEVLRTYANSWYTI